MKTLADVIDHCEIPPMIEERDERIEQLEKENQRLKTNIQKLADSYPVTIWEFEDEETRLYTPEYHALMALIKD